MPVPPPPPPPPMPGLGGPGPPPPPPPPGGLPNPNNLPLPASSVASKDRGALLGDITKGQRLKKTETNDRSAPILDKTSSSSGRGAAAPAIPGVGKPTQALMPHVPGGLARGRSEGAEEGGSSGSGASPAAPQLGGIFAGVGMPKLKKTDGGINTKGDNSNSVSSKEAPTSKPSFAKPLDSIPPKPPTAPRLNALRPTVPTSNSSPPPSSSPPSLLSSVTPGLRKAPPKPAPRPNPDNSRNSSSSSPPRAPPPPPGVKPPPPPISLRKPSSLTSAPASSAPPPPTAPPPPPSTFPQSQSSDGPNLPAKKGPPTTSAPPPPPSARSTPPPPPSHSISSPNITQKVAMQAARNAFGNGPGPSPSSARSMTPQATPSPLKNPVTSHAQAPTLDASATHVSNGASPIPRRSLSRDHVAQRREFVRIDDPRFHFQDESQLPPPREFLGAAKQYRAGRGSSVPLDLSNFQ